MDENKRPDFVDKNFPTIGEILSYVRKYVMEECNEVYPEDEWTSIGDFWDINLWMNDLGKLVTVYPVVNGTIITSSGITFIIQRGEE